MNNEQAYRKIARRHSDIPQDPLPLDIPDQPTTSTNDDPGRTRPVKSIEWAVCGWHTPNPERPYTGLVIDGHGDLVFREHTKRLGKRTVRCPGSGKAPK